MTAEGQATLRRPVSLEIDLTADATVTFMNHTHTPNLVLRPRQNGSATFA